MKTNPDAAGLDAARLERITDHLDRRYIDAGKLAGCQVTVARHGEVGYFRSFGSMDLERGKDVREDTIWRIYSMTKPITGVALMSLYERGHFQLGDPVHRFIPEWQDLKVKEGDTLVEPQRPMTVRDCLMHMTGLSRPEMSGRGARDRRDGYTLADMVTDFASQPLVFHPGTRWLYGMSTDVCGRLVEIISGQRFDEYLQEHVFGPLLMEDTAFTVPEDKVDRFAANYRRDSNRTLMLVEDPQRSSYTQPKTFFSGGGGLVSTSADYLRFSQMLLNGGELDGVRVLGRKTVELMSTNHLPGGGELRELAFGPYGETGFDGVGFGLTMAVSMGPVATQCVGSAGDYYWGGAASTIFWIDPAEDLVVIFMTQFMPSGTFNFRNQLKTLVYPAIVD